MFVSFLQRLKLELLLDKEGLEEFEKSFVNRKACCR
jgi:hypothetical protein